MYILVFDELHVEKDVAVTYICFGFWLHMLHGK